MRHLFVVGLLVTLAAMPAVVLAQPNSSVPVSGTMTSIGTLNGPATIGGVTGTITSSGGAWTMTVAGATFATGTYACSGGSCSYTGTIVGSARTFGFTTSSTTGTITAARGFPTHGAWVSTVAHWSAANRAALTAAGGNVGHTVSDAARFDQGGGGRGADHDGGHGADKH